MPYANVRTRDLTAIPYRWWEGHVLEITEVPDRSNLFWGYDLRCTSERCRDSRGVCETQDVLDETESLDSTATSIATKYGPGTYDVETLACEPEDEYNGQRYVELTVLGRTPQEDEQ